MVDSLSKEWLRCSWARCIDTITYDQKWALVLCDFSVNLVSWYALIWFQKAIFLTEYFEMVELMERFFFFFLLDHHSSVLSLHSSLLIDITCIFTYQHWTVIIYLAEYHANIGSLGGVVQPHGFFNCSPAVDVPPPVVCEMDLKDSGATKPIQNELIAKL